MDGDGRPDLILTSACADNSCNATGKIEDGLAAVLINTSTFPNSAASTTTLVSSLNPSSVGQSVTFTATVSSSGAGTFAGTVSLLDGSTSLGLFPVSGGGIATAAISALTGGTHNITATYNGSADFTPSTSAVLSQNVLGIVLSAASLNFGGQNIGTTSRPQTVMLTNTEKTPVSLSSISITGANAGNFAQTNSCPSSLSANGSCSISVTFTPTASAGFVANLSISDSLPGSPQTVALSGVGEIPAVTLSPASITFPSQSVGTSGLPQTVTLTNNSGSSINISSVTTSAADFGSLNACGSTLNAASSCSIGVFFDPTEGGSRSGALTVVTTPTGTLTASLSGAGEDFSLASSSPSATVTPGQTATYVVSISPMGGFSQKINLSCSGVPAQSTCSLSSNSVALNGSKPASVTVTVTTAGNSAGLAPPDSIPPNLFSKTNGCPLLCVALVGLLGLVVPSFSRYESKLRGRFASILGFACFASLALSLLACGGSGGGGTPANTYHISITGSFASGATTLAHTEKLTLIVE